MNGIKIIRDSIHGYIEIEPDIAKQIIDSELFQRLKRIEQTSMRCLYPAARHDRFIHSIGTYYLSTMIYHILEDKFSYLMQTKEYEDILPDHYTIKCIGINFTLAALLHDIGHSPFSHTLENYFKFEKVDYEGSVIPKIEAELFDEVRKICGENYKFFQIDFRAASPAAHEIVSSIVLLRCFIPELTSIAANRKVELNLEFLVRAIMGVLYLSNIQEKSQSIKNCYIKLLNSSAIDVDKLDYITRDSQLSGFDNVIVDTNRLLNSLTPSIYTNHDQGKELVLAFNKTALSVVQNVIISRNSLYTWIYSHHKVKYESDLLERSIAIMSKEMNAKDPNGYICRTFSVDNIIRSLLCDDDIWCNLKSYRHIAEINEIFDRRRQKKAIWKSIVEFRCLFPENEKDLRIGDFSIDTLNALASARYDDQKEFLDYLSLFEGKHLQFKIVNASIKLSNIGHNAILININNSLVGYDILLKELNQSYGFPRFFYLYTNNDVNIDKQALVQYIKEYPKFKLLPPP